MPARWSSLFKEIPWSDLLGAAASVAEGARNIWSRMAKKEAATTEPAHPLGKPGASVPDQLAALELRVQALEKKTGELGQEAVSSFEVVRSLTEQHSQVVRAVDALIARNRVLLRVCVLLAAALIALLVLVAVK